MTSSVSFQEWCEENNSELISEWSSNNQNKPSDVSFASNKYVEWVCKEGHVWNAPPKSRIKGHGCPYCAGRKPILGKTDLKSQNPRLADEWDYEKNDTNPEDYTTGSGKKVWWICKKCNYSWQATILSRKTRGCPRCNNKIVWKGVNDLASQHPRLAKEWSDNNTCGPDEVFETSSKIALWVCALCKHEWSARISSRVAGNGCPFCSNHKIISGENDFAHAYPNLAEEWSIKNGNAFPNEYAPHSNLKFWWSCKLCGHEWQASIDSRVRGRGCPECAREYKVSTNEKAVAFYVKTYFPDMKENYVDIRFGQFNFDMFIPSIKVIVEYDGCQYHKDVQKDLDKNKACVKNGFEIIRLREIGLPIIEGCTIFEVNYKKRISLENTIKDLFSYILKKYKLDFKTDIDLNRDYQKILDLKYTSIKDNSVATDCLLLSQWSSNNGSLSPYKVSIHSNVPIRWHCEKCGYEWVTSPNVRSRGVGCSICAGKTIVPGFNDAKSRSNPELAREWSPKNELRFDQVAPGSHKKAIWICRKCGGEWEAEIKSRVLAGNGCPYCAGKKKFKK